MQTPTGHVKAIWIISDKFLKEGKAMLKLVSIMIAAMGISSAQSLP
jgi:hypothetical protein